MRLYAVAWCLCVSSSALPGADDRADPSNGSAAIVETGKIPLCDMGMSEYQGLPGGLYPDRANHPPAEHQAAGLKIATEQIQPLDNEGRPDPDGKIVMISIGMSITNMEFAGSGGPDFMPGCFKTRMDMDPARNPTLVIVNGAQGGQMTEHWVDPNFPPWRVLEQNLAAAGVTPAQVQVAWVKQAAPHVRGWPLAPRIEQTRQDFEDIARAIKTLFPNIRIAYYSTRRFSTARNGLSVEPVCYDEAFAVRAMIERQINGRSDLNYDPARGEVLAPWLAWGPYLWADGINPRSDGLDWRDSGGGHPSVAAARKVADMLIAFCKTDPTATPWLLRADPRGRPPDPVEVIASSTSGPAPLKVVFEAVADDADGQVIETVWSFDDGTFGHDPTGRPNHYNVRTATKTFFTPGRYNVRLTAIDDQGNAVHRTIPITVGPPSGDQPPTARFTADSEKGAIPLRIVFNASESTDDSGIVSYEWDFDDGALAEGPRVVHTYNGVGRWNVKLSITDDGGNTALVTHPITAIDPNHNEPPTARFTLDTPVGAAPLTITVDSDPSYDLEGLIVLHEWDFGDGTSFSGTLDDLGSGAAVSHTYTQPGTYVLQLTVTDERGATGTARANITVLPGNTRPPRSLGNRKPG